MHKIDGWVENGRYRMKCGCSFQILSDVKEQNNDIPPIEIDYYNINYSCPMIWELFCSGDTIGVFQLEQSLGQNYSEKVQPRSLSEVAALTSIIRPGTLRAVMEDGKTAATHFVARKNLNEEVESLDNNIDDITHDTFGLIIYQETAMQIASKVAGFNLQQADALRKAMGKKDAELMAKVRTDFIDGCKRIGVVSSDKAEFLFDIIEKSNRYSFNKCWDLSTVVTTPEGYKLLDEINIGDMVLCPKNDIENEFVLVEDKIYHDDMDMVEFTTETGKTVRCTLNHKFLCEDGTVRPLSEIIEHELSIMCED